MKTEPITTSTPRPVRRATLVQGWHELSFLHWPVDPEQVAPLLPAGTRPDTLDGVTYVGLVPFLMRGVGLGPGPGLPYLGTFCETNVRLYSVDGQGRRGVVFRSLDAARLIPALVGRLGVRLPYLWSAMRLRREEDTITYTCRRRGPANRAAASRAVVRIGEPIAEPTPLEQFLTARWGLHVSWHGRTAHLPNEHAPWPLHRAQLLHLDDDLVTAAGLPPMTDPPVSVLYSPGVSVRFGAPTVLPALMDSASSR
ncbi:YqjF family protein [Streptomyces sp. NPDC086787]|uniref:YqjF family protein n=1 Tax=Streptomyces sp. NPDC086787 TaxID=3365759 RepID=UPI0037F26301